VTSEAEARLRGFDRKFEADGFGNGDESGEAGVAVDGQGAVEAFALDANDGGGQHESRKQGEGEEKVRGVQRRDAKTLRSAEKSEDGGELCRALQGAPTRVSGLLEKGAMCGVDGSRDGKPTELVRCY
jgi:hypothetical protein